MVRAWFCITALSVLGLSVAAQSPNGRNVNMVIFGNGGVEAGSFRLSASNGEWVETAADHRQIRFHFHEVARDDWSVYLRDASRGIEIQLDLHTKKVMYSDAANPTRRELASILDGEGLYSTQGGIGQKDVGTATLPTANGPTVDGVAVANTVLYGETTPDICWQKTYPRGVGEPLSTCGPGQEKDGLLCYPRCRSGFDGVGPVCWRSCPAGFKEFGVSCTKPAPYGRGGGYTYDPIFNIVTEDDARRKCERNEGVPCEKTGLIIYPKCKKGFALVPPNICSPVCPEGFRNDGAFCAKESYGRTAGSVMGCRSGTQQSGALCYPACPSGSSGIGPVCWANSCPSTYPVNCGAACGVSQAACALAIIDQVQSTADMTLNVAALITTAGAATPALKAAQTASRSMRRTLSGAARAQLKQQARQQLQSAMRWKRQHDNVNQAQGWLDNADNVDQAAELMVDAYENGEFDFTALVPSSIADVEPTGVLALVRSFNKPICSQ